MMTPVRPSSNMPRDVVLVIENRIAALRQELATGEVELQKATRQQVSLQETMLRISGAIQVLEELLATDGAAGGNGHHPDG
jgi:hypothetical protein